MSISSEEDITGTSNTGPPKMKTEKGLQEVNAQSSSNYPTFFFTLLKLYNIINTH